MPGLMVRVLGFLSVRVASRLWSLLLGASLLVVFAVSLVPYLYCIGRITERDTLWGMAVAVTLPVLLLLYRRRIKGWIGELLVRLTLAAQPPGRRLPQRFRRGQSMRGRARIGRNGQRDGEQPGLAVAGVELARELLRVVAGQGLLPTRALMPQRTPGGGRRGRDRLGRKVRRDEDGSAVRQHRAEKPGSAPKHCNTRAACKQAFLDHIQRLGEPR